MTPQVTGPTSNLDPDTVSTPRHSELSGVRIRLWRSVAIAVTVLLLLAGAALANAVYTGADARGEVGYDAELYLSFPGYWRTTGDLYFPHQLVGPYVGEGRANLYPPIAMYLFIPMSVVPRPLWWILPLGVLGWHVVAARPRWWSWPILAAGLASVSTSAILVYGNSDMWSAATIALACRLGWPAIALAIKPSVLPIAFLWCRDRRWWGAVAVGILLSLPFGSLWLDWVIAIQNLDASPLRSLAAAPFLVLPIVAWLARSRDVRGPSRLGTHERMLAR